MLQCNLPASPERIAPYMEGHRIENEIFGNENISF